ncbi:MAG: primosomal protein N' [Candidatus Azotimanducaceae bacterium]|jgi:primosomal protein N'
MYIVEVIPLTRGSYIASLTYYSGISYNTGSIIEVPLRKSTVYAMVVGVTSVSAARTAVRAATFSLKKLPEQRDAQPLPPSLIETAKMFCKSHPAQLGSVLYALLPPEIRDGSEPAQYTAPLSHADIRPEVEVLQATYDNRFIAYRSKIREVFAHRGSVLLVVPTAADIDRVVEILSNGIEDRVVIFSPHLTKKKMAAAYASFYDLTNAKLIVTTPGHAYIDRHDITHIIVEQSRSRYYKGRSRPYLDHRDVLKILARVTNRTMTYGDILPRSEDENLRREDIYTTYGECPKRLTFSSDFEVVVQETQPSEDKPFELFSQKLKNELQTTIDARGRAFVYAARRGIAPVVICIDCGHIFRCPDSGAPYSLFKTMNNGEEERWFLSQASGKRIRAADTCTACGSWRLRERGIGIQHIHSELQNLFPYVPMFLFDHTTATTYKKARTILGKFYDTKGSVLIGTQMALPYIEQQVDLTAITSHDATRSIPTWRAEEEFFGLLLTLRDITSKKVLLQTRTEPDELIEYAKQGLVEQFFTDELELRKALSYPPFSVFILLTWQDTKEAATETEGKIAKLLEAYKPKFYSAPQSLIKKTTRYGLIRIEQEKWPISELISCLRALPPSIKIEINPDRIV